jgi:hypothetical protein
MAIIEIPTLTDGTLAYDQVTTLEDVAYAFTFRWNVRRELWSFSIAALDGTPILTGQTVHLDIPLTRRAVGGPPGTLIAVSSAGDDPPALLDLGGRVRLTYIESTTTAAELEALAGA